MKLACLMNLASWHQNHGKTFPFSSLFVYKFSVIKSRVPYKNSGTPNYSDMIYVCRKSLRNPETIFTLSHK